MASPVDAALIDAHARAAPFTDRLLFSPPPDAAPAVPAADLLAEPRLSQEVAAYAEQLGTKDLHVAGSLWAKAYAGTLVPGVLALMTLEGVALDASAPRVRIVVRDHVPEAALLADPAIRCRRAESPTAPADAVMRSLFRGHLDLLVTRVARATGVPPAIPWSSIGNLTAWCFDNFTKRAPDAAAVDRRAFLDAPDSPVHDPVRYTDLHAFGLERRVQVRRACCLRYRLDGKRPCYSCPRIRDEERARLLSDAAMR